jgi:hypothetical protein
MDNIIELQQAQANQVTLSAPVLFRDAPEGKLKTEFDITAYTGAVVDRWWGKLAIDVEGIKAKAKMPIFREHFREAIVGYSMANRKENGKFMVSGKFSSVTDAAREVQALASDGFPWQASIGVKPLKIMAIEQGATAEVNGQDLEGPAEIWLESEVFETSFVALGADDNTQVACFSQVNETPAPAGNISRKEQDMEITLSLLESKAPELLAKIRKDAADEAFKQGEEAGRAAGAADELARIKGVSEQAMAGHGDLITKLMFDGKTTGPEAAVQVLAAEKKITETALENLSTGGIDPVNPSAPPEVTPPKAQTDPDTEEEFKKDKELVEEFGDFETYAAFKQACEKGLVRILTGKKGA